MSNLEVVKYKVEYYNQVNDIYENSFPEEERYITLDEMVQTLDTELYCLVENDIVLGMIYLIFYKDMVFILYLAVNTEYRDNGYGSYLLKWCLEKYSDKKIFLNIEEVKKDFSDYEIRKKRLDFYLKNGFYVTDYISREENIIFNILSNNLDFDLEQYKELDAVIAKILDEPISNIVKL